MTVNWINKMEIIHTQENLGKSTIIYASKEEATSSPEIIRHICDSGPSKRKKALELGILSQVTFDKCNSLPVYGDIANGCGYKDFSFISKKGLHELHGSAFIDLKIIEDGKVIL